MKTNRWTFSTVTGLAALALALSGCSDSGSGDGGSEGAESSAAETTPASGGTDDGGDSEDNGDDEQSDSAQQTDSADSAGLPADADLSQESPSVSPEDAIAAALKESGDGTVYGIELDYDRHDRAWQYEVSILKGSTDYDIDVDAETGKVVDTEKDSTDDREEAIDLEKPMTFDEALELAQDKGQGRLTSWKLEFDDGHHEYQFEFDDEGEETEVTVDVETERVTLDD